MQVNKGVSNASPEATANVPRTKLQSRVTLSAHAFTEVLKEKTMTVCPIAIVSGCAKCPIFKVCPVKGVIGDYVKPVEKQAAAKSSAKKKS
jgi:hypothetical protein